MNPILKQLRENWVIIVFIGMLIISWTNQNSRLVNAEKRLDSDDLLLQQINQININVAVMQTDIHFIKQVIKK